MSKETHYRKLENMMHSAAMVNLVNARVKVSEGEAEITLPVDKKLFHAAGALHGSMSFLALDNAAFFAVNSLVENVFVLTTSFTIYLTRPVDRGMITARGRVLNQTRTQFIAEAVAYDDLGRVVARGTGTFVRSRKPLDERIGYC
jgi:uncharacterized protein (TIGR00369 family)